MSGIPPKKLAQKELSELTDQQLLDKGRKMKLASIANAFVIGFMFGVVVYSIWKNTWGLLTLIPLFFIYKLTRNSGNNKELKKLLKERNLMK
ncbi:MAG: FUSC family protein [Robiginitalea sp.]|nr:FUSC family protein [Robiginitalea sp.]